MSPLTNSTFVSPSRDRILAWGVADTTRTWLGELGLNLATWTGWVSELVAGFVAEGSTDLNALSVLGVIVAKSWSLMVQSIEPVIIRDPDGSTVIVVMGRV